MREIVLINDDDAVVVVVVVVVVAQPNWYQWIKEANMKQGTEMWENLLLKYYRQKYDPQTSGKSLKWY